MNAWSVIGTTSICWYPSNKVSHWDVITEQLEACHHSLSLHEMHVMLYADTRCRVRASVQKYLITTLHELGITFCLHGQSQQRRDDEHSGCTARKQGKAPRKLRARGAHDGIERLSHRQEISTCAEREEEQRVIVRWHEKHHVQPPSQIPSAFSI
jgi:hypothetical protein